MDILELSEKLNISQTFAKILMSRGIQSEIEARRFLSCNLSNLADPFTIFGMNEVVERLKIAIANKETITIFGDYDADGICSVAILFDYFTSCGCEVYWYIPEREEGYGVSIEAVEFIAENHCPDIILTCDCGISCRDEIEYIKELGIEPIVTDHHELPNELPDCLIINPKLNSDNYLYDLCGGGVVFKLIEALEGREFAKQYLDIAAIATIADSVPLTNENRLIVKYGLKLLNKNPRKGIKSLAKFAKISSFDARTLCYTVIPRINAAGRIGKAQRAIELFFDESDEIAIELDEANSIRQNLCNLCYNEATLLECFNEQKHNKILVLHKENWQTGIIGIVASKLIDKYRRPIFMLSESDGIIKGSGRSVASVNLFELISSMSELFTNFGGHSQACGITMQKENLPLFIQRANDYLKGITIDDNINLDYDCELDLNMINPKLCEELELLEPIGVGNRAVVFKSKFDFKLDAMKNHKNHYVANINNVSFVAFNFEKYDNIITANKKKTVYYELGYNVFNGRKSIRANIKDVSFDEDDEVEFAHIADYNYIMQDSFENTELSICNDVPGLLSNDYGTVVISYDYQDAREFANRYNLSLCLFENCSENNRNVVVFAPSKYADFSIFENVLYIQKPIATFVCSYQFVIENVKFKPLSVKCDRGQFAKDYSILISIIQNFITIEQFQAKIAKLKDSIQLYFSFLVLLELGVFYYKAGNIHIDKGIRVELSNSKLLANYAQ